MSLLHNITDDYYTSSYTGSEQTVLATILIVIIILSIYGNGGMLVVLYRNDRMWNSTNILIGNLAVAGTMTTILIMPFSLTSMVLQKWPFAEGPVCKFNAFLASQLLLYTIFIHTTISMDKYFAVVKPFSRAMTVRRTWIASFTLWSLATFMSLGPLIHIGEYHYNQTALICGVGFPRNNIDSIYMLLLFALGFIIPNLVNAYVYLKVFLAVRKHSQRLHKNTTSCSFDVVKLQKRLVLTAFFSLLCFLLCWTPFALYVSMAIVSKSISNIPHGLGVSAYWSGYMYNAINPLIICSMSSRFGDGLYELTTSIVYAPIKFIDYCLKNNYEKGQEQSNTSSENTQGNIKDVSSDPVSVPRRDSFSSNIPLTAESNFIEEDEKDCHKVISMTEITLSTNHY